jgi:hypothetical protein
VSAAGSGTSHVASFGSVEVPPSVEDRIAFWQRLHERVAKLANRLDATAQAKLLGDIHAPRPDGHAR